MCPDYSGYSHGVNTLFLNIKEGVSMSCNNSGAFDLYTIKKAFRYSRSQPGCHLPNSPWAGIMTSYINYSCPGRVW